MSTRERTVIVGAGPIGLACALSARRRGLDPLIVDAGPIVASITRYPVGMRFFTTPELLEIGSHPFVCSGEKPTREEALKYYRGIVRKEGLRVRTYERLQRAGRHGDHLRAEFEDEHGRPTAVECERLVLATGYFEHPRRLDVPGEDLPHVKHVYDEGHLSTGRDVVVVGGKNSAVEAALDLFRCGARVTLVHRRDDVGPTVKYWMRPDILNRVKAGEIAARFETRVTRIEPERVHVESTHGADVLPAHRVYLLTGYQPNFELLRRCGVTLADETLVPALDPDTFESRDVRGLHLAGSITSGRAVSDVFIENGRFDGEKIFADLPLLPS